MSPPIAHREGIRPRRPCARIPALCAALLLAAAAPPPSLSSAGAPGSDSITERIPAGPRPVRNWPVILGNSIRFTPAVADIDGDGRDEIAVSVKDCRVFLLDGEGRILPGWPRETAARPTCGLMMDDIDGDGRFEIACGTQDGLLHMWRDDGTVADGWPVDLGGQAICAPAPVRARGSAEAAVLVAVAPGAVHLLSPDGGSREGWPRAIPFKSDAWNIDRRAALAADLDGDGSPEILHLSTSPAVLSAWRIDGAPYPGYPDTISTAMGIGIAIDDAHDPGYLACATVEETFLFDLASGRVVSVAPSYEGDGFLSSPSLLSSRPREDRTPDLLCVSSRRDRVYLYDLEGTLLPGWPVRLDGFIYGLRESQENHIVYGPPIACDVDGDGVREIVLGSYDHHLYCFELDGSPVPGWPVVLEDFILQGLALAQLDGEGAMELVAGQFGETLFAFHLGPPPAPGGRGARGASRIDSEWPPAYYGVSAAILAMAVLLVYLLRGELLGPSVSSGGVLRGALVLILLALAVRAVFAAGDLYRYRAAGERLAQAESRVRAVLVEERGRAQALADRLASGLMPCDPANLADPLRSLRCLEQLADRNRLEYRFAGVVLADRSGRVIQGVGLGSGWSDLGDLGLLEGAPADPILLDDIPAFAVEASPGVAAGRDTLRFFLLSSLLNRVPNEIVDATGFSAHIRVDGRTVAWGGAGQRLSRGIRPWLGSLSPSREVAIAPGPDGSRMSILLAQEDFDRPLSQWLDFAAVLVLPCLYLLTAGRRDPRARISMRGWWLASFAALYIAGAALLQHGRVQTGPVPLAGRIVEVLLHMIGVAGFVAVLFRVATSQRSRQLNFTMLGSYLIVSLIPLSVLMMIGGNLLLGIQRDIVGKTMSELEARADNLALAYTGNMAFTNRLGKEAPVLLEQSIETAWLNFVEENQYLFNYDLPTAYLTLWARERGDPGRYFTGYSYRAPRTGKLYYERPEWTGRENIQGLFLDNGTAVIRAMRTFRIGSLEMEITGHIPIDEQIVGEIEERLRVLSFLPRVHLEPAWLESTGERSRPGGWRIPYSRELVLQARDWQSGTPRWVVYRAGMYIPSGKEMPRALVAALVLILLPLALSLWGAYTTFRRTALPLGRLLTGIRRVGEGALEFRLGEAGRSEIGRAARAFDAMAESLEKTVSELAEKRKVEEVSALKSRFISMVSHDLKTPLSSIRGATENILEEVAGPVTERQRAYLEMILRSSDDLQKMIADLLDLSRLESGRLTLEIEPLDLRHDLEDLLRSFRPVLERGGIKSRLVVRSPRTIARGDRTRVWQVLSNLVSNAARHCPEGGTIEIRIEEAPAQRTGGRPMLMVSVIDEGPGVAEEDLPRIFEPFFYRPYGGGEAHGAGLGLAIVRQLVELHGGTVSVGRSPSPSGGAVFSFTLPV